MRSSDVVIAGAGIVGLSAALELGRRGLRVTVLERGFAMREASWAAAGMLAAGDPENPLALGALSAFSLGLYASFLRLVEELSGVRVPLRTSVTLQGVHAGLGAARVAELVAGLVPGGRDFLRLDEQSLDPRDLCRALPLAVRAAGVSLVEQTLVERVERVGGSLRALTSNGAFEARQYVHCCGAWSGSQSGLGGFALPVEPRKGQIVAVTMPEGAPVLECVVRTPEIYLVPRGSAGGVTGRRIVVGATVERAGFDRTATVAATDGLLAAAGALWPPIRLGKVTECWTGLRPATPDGLPVIGPAFGLGNGLENGTGVWIAAGHFRNGILLAPGTARVLAQTMLGEPAAVDLTAFSAGRFAAVEAVS